MGGKNMGLVTRGVELKQSELIPIGCGSKPGVVNTQKAF